MKNVIKNKKFLIFLAVVAVLSAVIVGILVGGAPKRHNASIKKNMQKSIGAIAEECGLENFEVVYVDDDYWTKIVLSCDKMSEISYDNKTKFFDDAAEAMKNKGAKFEFYDTEKVAIYSDGNRYTAAADTLTYAVYENGNTIDPATNTIKVNGKYSVSESSAVDAAN